MRHAVAAAGMLMALLMTCIPTSGQTVLRDRQPGVVQEGRLTAFIAYAPRFTRAEHRRVLVAGEVRQGDFAIRHGAGHGAGAAVEIRAFDVVRLGTGFTFLRRGRSFEGEGGDTTFASSDVNVVLSRASVIVRFQEGDEDLQRSRLHTGIYAGPAYMLEIPRSPESSSRSLRAMGNWGFAAGLDAEIDLSRSVAVNVGVEDYLMYWNEEELGRRIDEGFAVQGLDTSTLVSTRASHGWVFRAGLAFSFR